MSQRLYLYRHSTFPFPSGMPASALWHHRACTGIIILHSRLVDRSPSCLHCNSEAVRSQQDSSPAKCFACIARPAHVMGMWGSYLCFIDHQLFVYNQTFLFALGLPKMMSSSHSLVLSRALVHAGKNSECSSARRSRGSHLAERWITKRDHEKVDTNWERTDSISSNQCAQKRPTAARNASKGCAL